jgi:nitrate/nitrite-specific signal transduction histidine kinase
VNTSVPSGFANCHLYFLDSTESVGSLICRPLWGLFHLAIAREAIYNAFRHSRANVIEVELVFGRGELQLRVRDDGKGFEPAPPQADSRHLGLKNMKKRAEKLDAIFRIWTRPGTGTEVEVRSPSNVSMPQTGP